MITLEKNAIGEGMFVCFSSSGYPSRFFAFAKMVVNKTLPHGDLLMLAISCFVYQPFKHVVNNSGWWNPM